jgi:hypothetical protein
VGQHRQPLQKARRQQRSLIQATDPKPLAFDHVENVLGRPKTEGVLHTLLEKLDGKVKLCAVYAARGQPTKWQPKTKADHRRCVGPGVWVIKLPDYPERPIRPSADDEESHANVVAHLPLVERMNRLEQRLEAYAFELRQYHEESVRKYGEARERIGLKVRTAHGAAHIPRAPFTPPLTPIPREPFTHRERMAVCVLAPELSMTPSPLCARSSAMARTCAGLPGTSTSTRALQHKRLPPPRTPNASTVR